MQRVATAVGVSALLLASGDPNDARAIATLVTDAGLSRLALEQEQGRAIVATAADRTVAERTEDVILDAWTKWYDEAIDSVRSLTGRDAGLDASIAEGHRRLHAARGGAAKR
jgi:hypothetical protein